ncbi:hypothetical protein LTS08_001017 [Lithohypha guttulata]|nr:hypothetical protein LTS08_001017 [Lithohypha guttulata]
MAWTFERLATEFLSNATLQEAYGYRMPGAPPDAYHYLLNRTGCEALRGTGSDLYDWPDSANTINTWVLPFTGLLLQAPFDSNDAMGTFWAISRWVGGPMASLTYILWNMRSSANCAAFLDKATRRNDIPEAEIGNEKDGKQRSDFASYRDAFFLLSVMNQFTINLHFNGAAAEKLLKVALFSQQLRLPLSAGGSIEEVRQALARDTREARKRGTVQCFLAQLWFIFGLVISIQQSFGFLGDNANAQNLALGLAMIWFSVLMLSTVVDRNPALPEATQRQLNIFLGLVREALLRDAGRHRDIHQAPSAPARVTSFNSVVSGSPIKTATFTEAIRARSSQDDTIVDNEIVNWFDSDECDTADLRWIDSISSPALDDAKFFYMFAGQGRHLWHYGVAYPVIRGLKKDGILDARRGWSYGADVRQKLIATKRWDAKDRIHSWDLREFWQIVASFVSIWMSLLAAFTIAYFTPTVGLGCRALGYMQFGIFCTGQGIIEMFIWAITPHHKHDTKFYKRTRFYGKWILRVCELTNLAWLMYIIFAQALGIYNTCYCKCSNYGIGGGYINLNNVLTPLPQQAKPYWLTGTIMGCTMMVLSFIFIAWEWVTQSHMSTEDYEHAMKGLRTTRRFKSWTRWLAPLQA